jgi:transposase
MLHVEIRFMIKDLYRRGLSVSEIARITGHDRKTIRSMVHGPLNPAPAKRKPRASKLDPFVPYLEKRIAEGVLNATKLLAEIKALGYAGGRSLVKGFVHPFREARQQQATVRFETAPGEQAQVDWGHFGFIEHHGCRRRLHAFVMTLGWSRAMYVEFTVSADAAWWLRCHVHAFQYFGGVPEQVLHDNLKTAVLERFGGGVIHWNPRYLDFADYYGFTPKACQPYRAQTKGKVESGIRYVRGNFWVGLHFMDLQDLNHQARDWLDLTANMRIHGTTGEVPFARLPLERLQSMADKPAYDTSLLTFRRSTKDCFVSYAGNYYSVPSAYARKTLKLKETEDGQLLIHNAQDERITQHTMLDGRNQRVTVPAHYQAIHYLPRPAQRTQAVQIRLAESPMGFPVAPLVEVRPLSWYDQAVEVQR